MADPITERIQQAFSKVIRGLGLSPAPNAVYFLQQPIYNNQSLPFASVSCGKGEDFEPICTVADPKMLLWGVKRPVEVYLAFASGGDIADNPEMRAWRDAIWNITAVMLQQTGLLPEANNVEPRGNPIFEHPGFRDSTVDWGGVIFTLETLEERPR